jgi:hypothetical protein
MRSSMVLGGRKVAVQRPRVRTAAGEVPLPTFQAMAALDPLDRRVVEQMLVGVATRQYARSLEPVLSKNSIHLPSLSRAMIEVEKPAQPLSASHRASATR